MLEQIKVLPRSEKFRLMEELDSPEWHENALRETVARVATGEERQLDWDEAKRSLRIRP
jgi:hypothetical protein